jgi:hypothetical protein
MFRQVPHSFKKGNNSFYFSFSKCLGKYHIHLEREITLPLADGGKEKHSLVFHCPGDKTSL